MVTLIRRRLGRLGLGGVLAAYLRLLGPAIVSAALLWLGLQALAPDLLDRGPAPALLALLVAGPVHLLLSLGGAHLLRVPEVGELVSPVLRRLRRG